MKNNKPNPDFFAFKTLKSAIVSEISEMTAASSVPDDDKIDFHIGNPVQDKRLQEQYLKMCINDYDTEFEDSPQFTLIWNCIRKSVAYTPRGGYTKNKPVALIEYLLKWFSQGQQEPLDYNVNEKEIILSNGGFTENLRIVFHALSRYLINGPADIFIYNYQLPDFLRQTENLNFHILKAPEIDIYDTLADHFVQEPFSPSFLVIGSLLSEETRRKLRKISLKYPLFFIEVNNAENHLSMAREAKLHDRVLRMLTPSVIDLFLAQSSVTILAGNVSLIKIIESLQFELKGTPAAAETELLFFMINNLNHYNKKVENREQKRIINNNNQKNLNSINNIFSTINTDYTSVNKLISIAEKYVDYKPADTFRNQLIRSDLPDQFNTMSAAQLSEHVFYNFDDSLLHQSLAEDFLKVFIKHHPYYNYKNCFVVSGSARTALSILGFHCGISEVIMPDLGWSYEHCFPVVTAVPMDENLQPDVNLIINEVKKKLDSDPEWKNKGVVILNNPHNASGQVFDSEKLEYLIKWLLENEIIIIDDLSYQNVAPADELKGPETLKQIGNRLYRNGYVTSEKLAKIITVHSLSKTDCFAGARLAVTEIADDRLKNRFENIISGIRHNSMAILLAYLFYRNHNEQVQNYWLARNRIFNQRMNSIQDAAENLPEERNLYNITITRPAGSMYPQLIVEKLPHGISLEWLAAGLASRGIGMIPLTAFARTADGYYLARKTFRLTLGGTAHAEQLNRKTRRVIIDLNRLIALEETQYNRKKFKTKPDLYDQFNIRTSMDNHWKNDTNRILNYAVQNLARNYKKIGEPIEQKADFEKYLNERIAIFYQRYQDERDHYFHILNSLKKDDGRKLVNILEREFYKDNIESRKLRFKNRLYDRTVHPTQMYSLHTDLHFNKLIKNILKGENTGDESLKKTGKILCREYLGHNVAINSREESQELLCDIKSFIMAEDLQTWNGVSNDISLLSFWGDWDGSTRPSGQGHRLITEAVIENVSQMAEIINILMRDIPGIQIEPDLKRQIIRLSGNKKNAQSLLDKITQLTNQLEKRYQSILPFEFEKTGLNKFRLFKKDPISALWQHNDRLEKKMYELRQRRRTTMEYYFYLNKKLRKKLYSLIPVIQENLDHEKLFMAVCFYRDLLKRIVITPRIHQSIVTSADQFSIDTTVHNMMEINDIAAQYGNPGMVMALQISMTTEPEAIIALDRKITARIEQIQRDKSEAQLSPIWLIPLFEDNETLENLDSYLNRLWEYANQSRYLGQEQTDRFSEIICELFIAGSDLSQQVGQPASSVLFRSTSEKIIKWLAQRNLVDKIRIKLGSGEPMQRQGGYYDDNAGQAAFIKSKTAQERQRVHLNAATNKSTDYARSPLRGVLAGGDFRTFQSTISEKLRYLSAEKRAQLHYHLHESQKYFRDELIRASEPITDTRLRYQETSLQELSLITSGSKDDTYNDFITYATKNFRDILYGRIEDVTGIHIISYFVSRTIPNLRDRPTVRPSREMSKKRGQQIIEKIARTLPLANHGSLLRAIGHNRAQSMILGINQLTCGLFRALSEFGSEVSNSEDQRLILYERIIARLPVYDILHTLRLYQDMKLTYLKRMENAFQPAHNSFLLVREDIEAIPVFLPLFQKQLIKRLGVDVTDFFSGDNFKKELLPSLRPDLAVLMQPDLFNCDIKECGFTFSKNLDPDWQKQVETLLKIPFTVTEIREKIWHIIEQPIFQQIESFVKLALAITTVFQGTSETDIPFGSEPGRVMRLSSQITDLLRKVTDDSMRQFLVSAVRYLTQLPGKMTEIPIDIIRALRDVERIITIEEQALSAHEQELIRLYVIKIARLCGENG